MTAIIAAIGITALLCGLILPGAAGWISVALGAYSLIFALFTIK